MSGLLPARADYLPIIFEAYLLIDVPFAFVPSLSVESFKIVELALHIVNAAKLHDVVAHSRHKDELVLAGDVDLLDI